jgi:hypothetical protein
MRLRQRYRELPVPDTSDGGVAVHDLRGFDPDRFTAEAEAGTLPDDSILPELEVAGWAEVSETGGPRPFGAFRAGVRFEPLDDAEPRLYSLVGWDEKFAAHNAALWKHGLLVHVPKGVVSSSRSTSASRTRSRAARSSGGCSSSPRRARASR